MLHKVKIVENLLYCGCENHWQCEYCGEAYPMHSYTKEQLEKFVCRNDYKVGDKVLYNPECKSKEDGTPRYIIFRGTILKECFYSSKNEPYYEVSVDEVIVDDSGNEYFEYLCKKHLPFTASLKCLKKI